MLASVAAMAVTAQAHNSYAVDISIANGQTVSTTQTLLDPGDSLTIEERGNLSTGPTAIVVNGADSTVTNRGSISTSGTSAYGLHSTAAGTLFTNSGTLVTTGECSYGVYAQGDYFTLRNTGTILTTNDNNSWGIHVGYADYATIDNNGTIETRGEDANGIEIYGAHARITNHGSLTTSGESAIGIYVWHTTGVDSHNVLTNTGTIRTTGVGSQAIWANARGMSVINSGTVASRHAEAIYMGQADQTLTLLQGSLIEGDIRFNQAGSATLNIGRGLDAVLTSTASPPPSKPMGNPTSSMAMSLLSSRPNRRTPAPQLRRRRVQRSPTP